MNKSLTKCCLLLLICLSETAFSLPLDKERGYQVEVIAFKHQGKHTALPETFSQYPVLPNFKRAHLLLGDQGYPALYAALPESQMRLNRDAQRIEKNPDYTLLFHYAWYQEEGKSRLLRLNSPQSASEPALDGTIRVSKGLYYYVKLDLLLPPHFVLKETRRLKKDETHYIDHPAFGLLVYVHPLMKHG
jgi:hypothetical protein